MEMLLLCRTQWNWITTNLIIESIKPYVLRNIFEVEIIFLTSNHTQAQIVHKLQKWLHNFPHQQIGKSLL